VRIERTRKPLDGRFDVSLTLPAAARGGAGATVRVVYPGDDKYAPALVTRAPS
jgi:hypothetical protein